MHASVQSGFRSFTEPLEGSVAWMYADIKGLITTGIGNLVDPVGLALGLPFVHKGTTTPASRQEIAAEWQLLKDDSVRLAKAGHRACEPITHLRLTPEGITALVSTKLAQNEAAFVRFFPDFASWPADAQLAAMSMCWALGPAFAPRWPSLTRALKARDWTAAAENCTLKEEGNPGVKPRNVADRKLFTNAAAVVATGADPSHLWYPSSPPAAGATPPDGGATPPDGEPPIEETQPEEEAPTEEVAPTEEETQPEETPTEETPTEETPTEETPTEETPTEETPTEETPTEETPTEETPTEETPTEETPTEETQPEETPTQEPPAEEAPAEEETPPDDGSGEGQG